MLSGVFDVLEECFACFFND